MDITEALGKLDPDNDEHWTSDGLPSEDYMRELTGDAELTREQITNVAPELTREVLIAQQDPEPQDETEPAAVEEIDQSAAKAELDSEIEELDKRVHEAKAQHQAALQKRHQLYQRQYIEYNHKTDTENRMAYLKRQAADDALREQKRRQVLAKLGAEGVKIGDLDPRAKIDQSLNARPHRDNQRKVRPLIHNPNG